MAQEASFLGTGWKFPPSFDKFNSTVVMSAAIEDIDESIKIILQTVPGERVMQPEFGCYLNKLVFENIDTMITTELHDMISYSLTHFEPRIKDITTEIIERNSIEGRIKLNIKYTIISTNTRHNLVFPFYILEGTNLPGNLSQHE